MQLVLWSNLSLIAILKYRWVSPSLLASGRLGPTATCGLPSCTSWTGATASTSPPGGVPTKPFVSEWPSHRRIQGPPPFIGVADFDWPCHLKVRMHRPSLIIWGPLNRDSPINWIIPFIWFHLFFSWQQKLCSKSRLSTKSECTESRHHYTYFELQSLYFYVD